MRGSRTRTGKHFKTKRSMIQYIFFVNTTREHLLSYTYSSLRKRTSFYSVPKNAPLKILYCILLKIGSIWNFLDPQITIRLWFENKILRCVFLAAYCYNISVTDCIKIGSPNIICNCSIYAIITKIDASNTKWVQVHQMKYKDTNCG